MQLHQLKPALGSRKKRQIVGRGEGSTLGQTAGKGQKGQGSRSGDTIMVGFEGGQTPLIRRIPKRGFNHPSRIFYNPINLETLAARFDSGVEISAEVLFKNGILKHPTDPFKVLGDGKLDKALTVKASKFSKSAEKAIKAAGGTCQVV